MKQKLAHAGKCAVCALTLVSGVVALVHGAGFGAPPRVEFQPSEICRSPRS